MIFVLRTFKWGNEAKGKKAQVHCVIIGFSDYKNNKEKKIFDDNSLSIANNINPYLVDAPDIIVERRKFPICDVPELKLGNLSRDGGNLILEEEEKNQIINENKIAEKWIKPFMGAEEFLNDKPRWCLWLVDASPHELRKCKSIMKRIENVKKFRINSKRIETQKLARTPTLFAEIRQPSSDYLIVPRTTSENRKYIPMDFVKRDIIVGDSTQIIPNATIYEFGVLESIVHMAWMRATCGRLGTGYIYSSSIVYNNFIWPNPTPKQKEKIEETAQSVLDARKLYPDSTLADLYDPNTMPLELTEAHEKLDKAVRSAYGNKGFETEEEIVASLMKLYKEAVDKEKSIVE